MTEITQKGQTLRIVLYGQAPVEPLEIPRFVERFAGAVIFVPDRESPSFLYKMDYNSRKKIDALGAVKQFLGEMDILYVKNCKM